MWDTRQFGPSYFPIRKRIGHACTAILLTAVFSGMATAQPSSTLRLSEYQKQYWQVEDGLPANNIRMVVQRGDGALMLATGSGLASFDGRRFRSAYHPGGGLVENEAVNAVLYGRAGDMWIGTDGRGVLHQTAQGIVNISEQSGRFQERIRMLYLDANNVLWIATQNGVERYVNGRLEIIPDTGMISGDITSPFAEDGNGGVFFVTSNGLFHWQDGVAQHYLLGADATDLPVSVYRDPQRHLWVGTMTHLLQLVPRTDISRPDTGSRFTPVIREALPSPVTVMLGDASGNLWVGTRHQGLWRLSGSEFSHWGSREGLPEDAIRSLFVDDEQDLWVGMLAGGLGRWRKGALAPLGDAEGFPASYAANVLADSHGDLWFGTWGNGLFRSHKGQVRAVSPPGLRRTTPIRALAEDRKGQLWVGTWFDGIYRYDGRAFKHYLLGTESPGNAVSTLLPDRTGGLWVGTYTGLYYFAGGSPDVGPRAQMLEQQLITCLLEDMDGSILVGTASGLYRIRDHSHVQAAGLAGANIIGLFLDKSGYAWATTKTGALAVVRANGAAILSKDSGIPEFPIYTGSQDGDGHLWLGTSHGIVRAPVAEMHAVADGQSAHISTVILGRADGMRSSECSSPSQPSSTATADGTLWFATTKGFVHTTDAAEKLGTVNPSATMTAWATSNDPAAAVDLPTLSPTLQLEPGQSDAILYFNAKSLANPDRLEYRYRLKGYDTEWNETRNHSAHYRRLPPGTYEFQVQARFSGQEWTSPYASIEIRQRPFFHQTWYFYIALGFLLVMIIAMIFRRRVQLIKGRLGVVMEERNRIASECHDTLMAGFAAIAWQMEATARLFPSGSAENTAVAQSFELARNMVSHCQAEARRIIWDLRDMDEVTSTLSQALSRAVSTGHVREDIETSFELEGDELSLTPGCVHHLLRIGQEAYVNAVRHASPTRIAVHLRYETDAVHLSIRDDGCGLRDMQHNTSRNGHFGMAVMEERARKIGGILNVKSVVGQGTEIAVKVAFSMMPHHVENTHSMQGGAAL